MAKKQVVKIPDQFEVLKSIRRTWDVNPRTKIKQSKKRYCRKKNKSELRRNNES